MTDDPVRERLTQGGAVIVPLFISVACTGFFLLMTFEALPQLRAREQLGFWLLYVVNLYLGALFTVHAIRMLGTQVFRLGGTLTISRFGKTYRIDPADPVVKAKLRLGLFDKV